MSQSHDAKYTALLMTLSLAVPMRISEVLNDPTGKTPKIRARLRRNCLLNWADAAVDEVSGHVDVLMYGGKPGEAAAVFNHLARGLAALAFVPGGVTFAGLHWCVEPHERCPKGPVPYGYMAHQRWCPGCRLETADEGHADRLCRWCQTAKEATG